MDARLLKLGLQGTDVNELQKALQKLGYRLGVDGKFGRETLSAVTSFQSWWGLGVDGVVGPKTRAAIQQALGGAKPSNVAARLLKLGLQGTDVNELQKALHKIGYKLGVDGKFGRETLSSVASFQSWWGLEVDGVVGPKTRAAIQQALGGAKPSKKAEPPTGCQATAQSGGAPDTWIAEEWYIIELPDDDTYEEWAEYELYAAGWAGLEAEADEIEREGSEGEAEEGGEGEAEEGGEGEGGEVEAEEGGEVEAEEGGEGEGGEVEAEEGGEVEGGEVEAEEGGEGEGGEVEAEEGDEVEAEEGGEVEAEEGGEVEGGEVEAEEGDEAEEGEDGGGEDGAEEGGEVEAEEGGEDGGGEDGGGEDGGGEDGAGGDDGGGGSGEDDE